MEPQDINGTVYWPEARWKHESVAVNNWRDIVLFGGCTTTNAEGVRNDLWVLNLNSGLRGIWRRVEDSNWQAGSNHPVPRRGHVVSANQSHLVIFSGKTYVP